MCASTRLPALAQRSLADPTLMNELLDCLGPENTNGTYRERAFKTLLPLAESHPGALLPERDRLAALLKARKAFSKYPAIYLIAALVPAETQRRFDRIFRTFFGLLDDEALSVAAHVARLAGPIALARPDLEPRITRRLLALDPSHFDPKRPDIVKSYALEAFTAWFAASTQQTAMVAFARAVEVVMPRAVKGASAFLWAHADW